MVKNVSFLSENKNRKIREQVKSIIKAHSMQVNKKELFFLYRNQSRNLYFKQMYSLSFI